MSEQMDILAAQDAAFFDDDIQFEGTLNSLTADALNSSSGFSASDLSDAASRGDMFINDNNEWEAPNSTNVLQSIKDYFAAGKLPKSAAGTPAKTAEDQSSIKTALDKMMNDPRAMATLLTSGVGLLGSTISGMSQAKLKEAQWEREDKALSTERERKNANSYAGTINPMTFKKKGTGLLDNLK